MSKRKPNHHRNKRKSASGKNDEDRLPLIYGTHAVRAALANEKRQINALYATQNGTNEISDAVQKRQIQPILKTGGELAQMLPPDAVHQGLVLDCTPLPALSIDEVAASGKTLVLLDQVSDPRNVGAILRAAAVFGKRWRRYRHTTQQSVQAPALGRRLRPGPRTQTTASGRSCGTVGALEVVPLIEVTNLARTLEDLHKAGYMSVGLDEGGEMLIDTVPQDRPLAVVMGAEGQG